MKRLRSVLLSGGLTLSLLGGSGLTAAQEGRALLKSQALYLPIYSHILYGNTGRSGKSSSVALSALVSLRNTSTRRAVRIVSARYFATDGKLLAERVPTPVVLPPLGTLELMVELNDLAGGSGANFIVRWEADEPVNPLLVEALHANMDGGKAVIFMTHAVPLAD